MRVIGDLSRLNAIRYPKKIALRLGDQTLTYEQLDARSNQLAHALIARGVATGDRVALLAYNRLDYAVVTQAVAKCGAILAPMNFRLAPQEIATILRDCEPKVLFMESGFAAVVAEAMPDGGPDIVFLPDPDPQPAGASTLANLCENQPASAPSLEVTQENPCVIMYTSGTTGAPKGVLVSHETYFRMYLATAVEASLRHDDIYLMAVPMFHAAGLNMMLHQALFMGASGVIHRGPFEPDVILKIIQDHHITFAILVPTTVGILAFHPNAGAYDLSSLDKIFYGSMPITPRILDQALKVFPNVAFTQLYGSTESGMLGVLRWADHGRWSQATGRQALLSEMRIVDDDGRPVPVGGVGEVIGARRTMGMIGYWRNDKATAETIRDGWIYTGDLARVEPEGFFTLVDRRKDLIISGGENIYPKEVENVLAAHPAVREVAVFGLPHDLYGESVCAAASLFPGQTVGPDELIAFCRGRIAGYKIPRRVEIVSALPRNASDKVQKGVLRAQFSRI
jgi:acyl-CoA synthetase (AMP-forming)/AMP-acid ligase II